ncbi:MAG: transcriptional regulator [Candidatus Omnitrophica bacterium]|nr:transcriptional regulator [Candidatus Omnitrophota bacterium]
MKTWNKKLLTVITEQRIEKEILPMIKTLGAHGYTITDARGEGSRGGRGGSWDETANIRIEIVCESDVAERIAQKLQKDYYANYAMILFMADIQTMRDEKF